MLTISQLARYAGCTVKAVRVYHDRGLLPEPPRDANGYRRYAAQDVIDATRIVTLVRSGVPLSSVRAILDARGLPRQHELERIDGELEARIRELAERRRRLALIDSPDRLCLTPAAAAHLDRIRALGLSEPYLQIERDSWILAAALTPEEAAAYLPVRDSMLDDPEYLAVMRAFDDALGWEPDDPRIEALALRSRDLTRRINESLPEIEPRIGPAIEALLNDYQSQARAWVALRRRVEELLAEEDAPGRTPPEDAATAR